MTFKTRNLGAIRSRGCRESLCQSITTGVCSLLTVAHLKHGLHNQADEKFEEIKIIKVGELDTQMGYSSFRFIPGLPFPLIFSSVLHGTMNLQFI